MPIAPLLQVLRALSIRLRPGQDSTLLSSIAVVRLMPSSQYPADSKRFRALNIIAVPKLLIGEFSSGPNFGLHNVPRCTSVPNPGTRYHVK